MADRKSLDPMTRVQSAAFTPMVEGIRIDGITKLIPKYKELSIALNKTVDSIIINGAKSLVKLESSFPATPLGDALKSQAGITKMRAIDNIIEKILKEGI